MKRLTLIISGKVQRAGYRDRVVEIGRSLGLTGYAENLPDGRVKVVAEGDEEKLRHLEESANIKNALINVENIESQFSRATGELSGFFKLVREGETDERLDTAAVLLKELIEVTRNGFGRSLEKQDSMLEKQDALLEVTEKGFAEMREETAKGFGEMKEEMHRGFGEVKEEMAKGFGDMRYGFAEVKEEIHLLRDDFRELFMRQVNDLRGEIAEIKATLARMQEAG